MTSITPHDKLETDTPEASPATIALLDALAGFISPPMSGQNRLSLDSPDHDPANGRTEEDEGVKSDNAVTEPTLDEIPPTPPLTRSENPHGEADETLDEDIEPVEADATGEWHPLDDMRRNSKDIMDQMQDTTFVDDSLVLDSDEKYLPVSAAAPRSQTSNSSLRIIPKPASPQPWDMVNPSQHGEGTDYYSTLGTKNFGTMQKNRYVLLQSFSSWVI